MATYLRLGADLQDFSSNLPIVILENWGAGKPGTEDNADGFWAIIEPDATTDSRAGMLDPLHIATRCGMRGAARRPPGCEQVFPLPRVPGRGRADDQGIKPLGMPRESDWVLSGRYVSTAP